MSRKGSYLTAALAVALLMLLLPLAPATAAQREGFSALIFSKTAAFRHTECIPQGTVAISQKASADFAQDGGDALRR